MCFANKGLVFLFVEAFDQGCELTAKVLVNHLMDIAGYLYGQCVLLARCFWFRSSFAGLFAKVCRCRQTIKLNQPARSGRVVVPELRCQYHSFRWLFLWHVTRIASLAQFQGSYLLSVGFHFRFVLAMCTALLQFSQKLCVPFIQHG